MTIPISRRRFLGASLAAGAAATWAPRLSAGELPAELEQGADEPSTASSRRMLVLGGTRFLGPEVVRAARAAGYTVTLFNRGKSNPEMFPDLEKIRGDRDRGELDGLRNGTWDVVVDTSGYVPEHVRATAELLADRIGLYVFISSISVYRDQSAVNLAEDAELADVPADVLAKVHTIRESFPHYAGMKALCERAAREAMGGRALNIRPGLIVGPHDGSDRFTYWPVRVHRRGEVLAPGDPDAEVQVIDVRDLGDWIVTAATAGKSGPYNAVGMKGRVSLVEVLHGTKIVTGADCSFTWVAGEFLLEHKVRPYVELPLWLPAEWRGHFDCTRAFADGLTLRPLGDTIRDTLAWHLAERREDHSWRAGMAGEREQELLAAWKSHRAEHSRPEKS